MNWLAENKWKLLSLVLGFMLVMNVSGGTDWAIETVDSNLHSNFQILNSASASEAYCAQDGCPLSCQVCESSGKGQGECKDDCDPGKTCTEQGCVEQECSDNSDCGPNEKCCSNETCDKIGSWEVSNVYTDSRKTLDTKKGSYIRTSAIESTLSREADYASDQCEIEKYKYEWKTSKFVRGTRTNYNKVVACSNLVKFKSEFTKKS
ncbi:MAG: hypothetical protein ABEJ65_09755, partial [bacterium]